MNNAPIIGVDLGGTNIRAGIVAEGKLHELVSQPLNAHASKEEVVEQVFGIIDKVKNGEVRAIGMALPGLADPVTHLLYDVVNIPAWAEIDIQQIVSEHYQLPVKIDNDANCFSVGEYYFGGGQQYESMVGMAIGTGLGTGIMVNGKLLRGKHGGAGEFGMVKYLDKNVEYYVSGRFFETVHNMKGELLYRKAAEGDAAALGIYEEFGRHLGEAVKMLLYMLDTGYIVIGGSLKDAFPFYSQAMWQGLASFEYKRALAGLKIEPSGLINGNILGAAALHFLAD